MGIDSLPRLTHLDNNQHRTLSQQAKFLIEKAIDKNPIIPDEVTFKACKNEPFQRWYPYIEGYSPNFVKTLIERNGLSDVVVYEPFAGTGTTILASDSKGLNCIYSEINPLLRLLISLKIRVQSMSEEDRKRTATAFIEAYERVSASLNEKDYELEKAYFDVFKKSKYFNDEVFTRVLRYSYLIKRIDDSLIRDLLNMAVSAVLVPISNLKKQGDLRFKTPKELLTEVKNIEDVLPIKVKEIYDDILNFDYSLKATHRCVNPNAKLIGQTDVPAIGAVITSPPYLNGTNYIRNTKLELWYLGYLKTESDLRYLRDEILTSGINDVKSAYKDAYSICKRSAILSDVISELTIKAYDKRIPLMAVCYFQEMLQVFDGLRSKLKQGAMILIDLGDSIFSNVHIPTDKILIEILENIGYTLKSNQVLRTRRSRNGSIISQFLITLTYNRI